MAPYHSKRSIQHNSKIFLIIFLKVLSERLGPGASFCVEFNSPRCLIKRYWPNNKQGKNTDFPFPEFIHKIKFFPDLYFKSDILPSNHY